LITSFAVYAHFIGMIATSWCCTAACV